MTQRLWWSAALVCGALVTVAAQRPAQGGRAAPAQGGHAAPAARGQRPTCCAPGVGLPLFRVRCSPCHGQNGQGDGPAAASLNPKPADLTDTPHRTAVSDSAARAVITGGRRTMPAFGTMLNARQIDTLVSVVRNFQKH